MLVSPDGGIHASYTHRHGRRRQSDGLHGPGHPLRQRSDYALADPSLLDAINEFGDGIQLQILSVFPGLRPAADPQLPGGAAIGARGVDKMDLLWTYFGFADDPPR